ncbi:hypothetical protein D3C86_1210660 [compost metagenome]
MIIWIRKRVARQVTGVTLSSTSVNSAEISHLAACIRIDVVPDTIIKLSLFVTRPLKLF